MSDTYTPEAPVWAFNPGPALAYHQQLALEFLLEKLGQEHHGVAHDLIAQLREQATETAYHDPQVGIVGDQDQARALDALANLLAGECPR